MLELYGSYVLALAGLIFLVGFLWLVVVAFKQRFLWGLAVLFIPPLALLFIPLHYRPSRKPLLLLIVGGMLAAIPYGLTYYQRHFVPLGPHEELVDGELRVTLTGVEGFDYATLADRPGIIVLQMANKDVNDQTLSHLKKMDQLRELDLNDTQITDEGLIILAELPKLESLRLARTGITDEGFMKSLATKESLRKLDLTGTTVKGKTKRDWKNAKPEQREYVD